MNEFIQLREFGAAVPGPSPEETSAARAALLAAIEAAPPLRSAASRHEHIGKRARPGRVRLALVAGAAAGLAAVAVTAAAGLGGAGGLARTPQHVQLTAALVLHRAAVAAARQAPSSGPVFFAESEYVELSGGALTVESGGVRKRQVASLHWSAPDLREFWLSRHGGGLVGDPAAGSRPVRVHGGIPVASHVPLRGGGFEIMGKDYVSWHRLSHLPTAPGPMRGFIDGLARQSGVQPFAAAEFEAISQLLYESPAPPAVRAALYNLAATLPGAKVVSHAHDILGRVATEVYLGGGDGQALLFSQATGAVLEEAGLSGSSPDCPPAWASAVLATGYVRSLGQKLPGAPSAAEPTSFRHSVPGCRLPGQENR